MPYPPVVWEAWGKLHIAFFPAHPIVGSHSDRGMHCNQHSLGSPTQAGHHTQALASQQWLTQHATCAWSKERWQKGNGPALSCRNAGVQSQCWTSSAHLQQSLSVHYERVSCPGISLLVKETSFRWAPLTKSFGLQDVSVTQTSVILIQHLSPFTQRGQIRNYRFCCFSVLAN